MVVESLVKIYSKFNYDPISGGADKGTRHSYIPVYDKFLAAYRNEWVDVLEVGILNGHSLGMWEQYFSDKAQIFGMDINPACAVHGRPNGPFEAIIGDSRTVDLADATFDIIIDDGDHNIESQVQTFNNLFPRLNAGGLYFIEDINDIGRDACVLKSLYPQSCLIIDLRYNKLRGDDVLVIYTKPPGG